MCLEILIISVLKENIPPKTCKFIVWFLDIFKVYYVWILETACGDSPLPTKYVLNNLSQQWC